MFCARCHLRRLTLNLLNSPLTPLSQMTVGKEDLLEEVKKIEEFKDQVKAAEKSKCEVYLLFFSSVTRGSHYVHRADSV